MLKLLLVFSVAAALQSAFCHRQRVFGCGEDDRKSFGVARDGVGSAKQNVLPRNSVYNLGD